ncbi:MAG: hypothetical protein LC105_04915 [Chitinophagales bacterium]|nr:hypothetical protein [Chitinophagales bacterium]
MLSYQIKFPHPELHYVEVELSIETPDNKWMEMYMPVWTPGSYMIREFSRHLDNLIVQNKDGQFVDCHKYSKNIWRFYSQYSRHIVKYRIYANDLTVRTNHVDIDHALLNGAGVFLAVKGYEQKTHQVIIWPHKNWKEISCTLPHNENKWIRTAENYDLLVDSPIEIGSHKIISFDAGGIPHELAIVGLSNGDNSKLIEHLKAIIDKEVDLFGHPHPCEKYVFIIHHTDNIYGGLEHLNSSVNMVPRWDYFPRDKYLRTISLLSHEYFHLWNIKRIRPVELGPFDYMKENYTRQLWAIEGITSYYDDYFVYLAGVSSLDEYLKIIADNISNVVNTPGNTVQSLGESSFDAWIKYYRGHENTHNNQVSYYSKGATVAIALNFLIMHQTEGEKSLDDVMRALYEMYLIRPNQGYSEEELLQICEEVAGVCLRSFFEKYIFGVEPINYSEYFEYAGLSLKEEVYQDLDFGWILEEKGNSFWVSKIDNGSSAANGGINARDEILALNGYRMTSQWRRSLHTYKVGDELDILVSRSGIVKSFKIEIQSPIKKSFVISRKEGISDKQQKILSKWSKI